MPTYIVVASYTSQGVKNIGDAPKRLEAYKALAKSKGARVKDFYWTLGQTDMLAIVEAPDDATIAAMSLATTGLGNVHGYTMRAFSPEEMGDVIGKM